MAALATGAVMGTNEPPRYVTLGYRTSLKVSHAEVEFPAPMDSSETNSPFRLFREFACNGGIAELMS